MAKISKHVRESTALFLFNYSKRQLHGIFVPTAPPAMNICPTAWSRAPMLKKSGRYLAPKDERSGSAFPAQVEVRLAEECTPLNETVFGRIVTYINAQKHFEFILTQEQTAALVAEFRRH